MPFFSSLLLPLNWIISHRMLSCEIENVCLLPCLHSLHSFFVLRRTKKGKKTILIHHVNIILSHIFYCVEWTFSLLILNTNHNVLLSTLTFSVGFGVFCLLFMRVGREGGLHVFRCLKSHYSFWDSSLGFQEVSQIFVLSLVCFSCHLGSPHTGDLVPVVGVRALTAGFAALDIK